VNTGDVETTIVNVSADATPDQFAAAFELVDAIRDFERRMRLSLKSKMLEQIEQTGRDITIGPRRYYAGVESETRCEDNVAAVDALLDAAGGDLEVVARDCLRSDSIKPSAARLILSAEAFDRLFKTTKRTVLKDGKPTTQRQLLCTDERFVRGTSREASQEK
jgi:hypothetical protein